MGFHRWELYHKQENGSQSIGARSYHPQCNKITTVNPGGTSTYKTMNRAELAGIAAALINKHTHIATDSAGALWQARNSILYPQHIKRHKHAKLLETIVHTSSYIKTPSISTRLKAHACNVQRLPLWWQGELDSTKEQLASSPSSVTMAAPPNQQFYDVKLLGCLAGWPSKTPSLYQRRRLDNIAVPITSDANLKARMRAWLLPLVNVQSKRPH